MKLEYQIRFFSLYILMLLTLAGCGGDGAYNDDTRSNIVPAEPAITMGDWYKPSVFSSWQWQLSRAVNTYYNVDIYDIDLFDSSETLIQELHSKNINVICYFSTGSYEEWRDDANRFTEADLGNTLDGWPGERWLDIRSANVHAIMKSRLDLAVQKKCDGVEPDNMDGYTNNSGFNLSSDDQLVFNRWIANEAHVRNLSVGLKNDLDHINDLVAYYDFAVNEQCFEYSECDLLSPFVDNGKAVFNAEYKTEYVNNETTRNTMCVESTNFQFSTLVLPLDLDDAFRFSCL